MSARLIPVWMMVLAFALCWLECTVNAVRALETKRDVICKHDSACGQQRPMAYEQNAVLCLLVWSRLT